MEYPRLDSSPAGTDEKARAVPLVKTSVRPKKTPTLRMCRNRCYERPFHADLPEDCVEVESTSPMRGEARNLSIP